MITSHFSHISHSLYRQTGNLPFLIPMHCYKDSKSIINLIRHSLQSVDITSRKFTFIKSRDTSSSPWHKFITVLQWHWCNLRQNCSDQSRSVKKKEKDLSDEHHLIMQRAKVLHSSFRSYYHSYNFSWKTWKLKKISSLIEIKTITRQDVKCFWAK